MRNKAIFTNESSYRKLHGKIFASLLNQFGPKYVHEIEDAIHNAFYKSLKSWKSDKQPENYENWLFIVARNDLLNQIKKKNQFHFQTLATEKGDELFSDEDLRLKTILFLTQVASVSNKSKVVFILKNIFGLHVKEISQCTLLSHDAIYKTIKRAHKDFEKNIDTNRLETAFERASGKEITIVEEILYAVFNMGFDSFSDKSSSLVDEEICLEALALTKMLWNIYELNTTRNLLALFCFHLSRLPEKVKNDKILSFFDQDKTKWNGQFISLGFHYLEKPDRLNQYYLESLIISRHMTTEQFDQNHWNEIIDLYQLLLAHNNSPVIKLNLCFCLSKAERTNEALELLNVIEHELPAEHLYFALVKANISEGLNKRSDELVKNALKHITQKIRRSYILDNL